MSIRNTLAVVSGLLALSSLIVANSGGPINGVTGGPGEGLCTDCHLGNPPNAAGGSITVTAPATYLPNEEITITVGLQRAGQSRWGFEATVLNASNQPVGTMLVTDGVRTQKSTAVNQRQYIKHTLSGTNAGVPNTAPGWSFKWRAPTAPAGTVTFYVAGNAANNNGLTSGDFIYNTSASVAEGNIAPTLAAIGAKSVDEGESLSFGVTASDLNGTIPDLLAEDLPANAVFVDNNNGTGSFDFTPDFDQQGIYQVRFIATDGSLSDTELVAITVNNVGPCCVAATGNVDCDPGDITDIADLTVLIDHLFITFAPLCCADEGNVDGDPSGVVDIADLTALIDHLFITFSPTAQCVVSYSIQIRPMLQTAGCGQIGCHGDGAGGSLNLGDLSYAIVRNAVGLNGPIISAGDAAASHLYLKVTPTPPFGSQMPLGGPFLTTEQQNQIRDWINQGALDN